MGLLILMGMHLGAIYIGAHIAGFEHIDIWRSAVIAFLSYIVMAVVGLLLSPLMLVPFLNMFVGAIVLGLGTAVAAKIVLSSDWKPAWTIGITVVVVNFFMSWVFSGCV